MRTESVVRAAGLERQGRRSLCAVLALQGCVGLDDVDIPELDGPSTFAQNLFLTATPDLLVADGVSQSVITAQFLDVNGRPAANQEIFFTIADEDGDLRGHRELPDRPGPRLRAERADGRQRRGPGGLPGAAAHRRHRRPDRAGGGATNRHERQRRRLSHRADRAAVRGAAAVPAEPGQPAAGVQLRDRDPARRRPARPRPSPARRPSPAVERITVCRNAPVLVQTTSVDIDGVIVRYLWNFGNGRTADTPDSITSVRDRREPIPSRTP